MDIDLPLILSLLCRQLTSSDIPSLLLPFSVYMPDIEKKRTIVSKDNINERVIQYLK